jgi:hypothetical protein
MIENGLLRFLGGPPPPPNGGDWAKPLPMDAQVSEDESFLEYLEKIDRYIAANMQGYADSAREVLSSIVLTPIEPCSIFTGGLMEHWAVLRRQNAFIDASNLPIEGSRVPQIIEGERFCNQLFDGFDPVHTYVRLIDTYERSIRDFHNYILGTAERFRHAVDRLINYRRLLTAMADAHPDSSGFTDQQINAVMGFNVDAHSIQRKNEFFRQNKLDVERSVGDYHFRVEALRQQLVRQFDELYARRVGWGYRLKNPGVRFLVYIRHAPCNIRPLDSKIPKEEKRDKRSSPVPKNNQTCVVDIDSIDSLNDVLVQDSNYAYKIIKFTEREAMLKREIDHVKNTYFIWLQTSSGWFNSHWYLNEYRHTTSMFDLFVGDLLKNPKYAPIESKIKIITEFMTLIQSEMQQSLHWYYDPQRSFTRIRNFIYKLYDGKYPNPPHRNGTVYHDELK